MNDKQLTERTEFIRGEYCECGHQHAIRAFYTPDGTLGRQEPMIWESVVKSTYKSCPKCGRSVIEEKP